MRTQNDLCYCYNYWRNRRGHYEDNGTHNIGDFALKGKELREQGVNRIGNLIIPNNNYVLLESWFLPLL
jgi:deoxyhypusine synthase